MLEFLRQIRDGIKETWQRLSPSARVNIGIALALTVGLILFVIFSTAHSQYGILCKQQDLQQVSKIQQVLTEQHIPYKLRDLGHTVEIPIEDMTRARQALAAADISVSESSGIMGYELLDNASIFESPEQHKEKVRRAMEGEIAKAISQLKFVKRAIVKLSIPEKRLLERDQKKPTASVIIEPKGKHRPTENEVETILDIVASSVGDSLDPSRISVASTEHGVLHEMTTSEQQYISYTNARIKKEWENQVETEIKDALKRLGKRAEVIVSAKMDFNHKVVTKEEFGDSVKVSEMKTKTESTSTESLPKGQAGLQANLPQGAQPLETNLTEKRDESLTNSEPARTVTRLESDGGEVVAYSAVVWIEGNYETTKDDKGNTVRKYVGMTKDELSQWQKAVAKAVSPDVPADNIVVMAHQFPPSDLELAQAALSKTSWTAYAGSLWGGFSLLLKALAILGVTWFVRKKFLEAITPQEEEEEEEVEIDLGPSPEVLRKQQIAEEVETLSTQQPDVVASLLRAWMSEETE